MTIYAKSCRFPRQMPTMEEKVRDITKFFIPESEIRIYIILQSSTAIDRKMASRHLTDL